jgi:hypothetical protein
MRLVAARTFLDVSTGQILTLDGVELYRVPYVQVPNAEACPPIVLPKRIRQRVIRYYDPATWKPRGDWGYGRYTHWTRKTTRPFRMWPEVWDQISAKTQHLAIPEWREEV